MHSLNNSAKYSVVQRIRSSTRRNASDKYCTANQLVFAIDSNFACVRDTITTMIHRLSSDSPEALPI